jgi:hypothetical protein
VRLFHWVPILHLMNFNITIVFQISNKNKLNKGDYAIKQYNPSCTFVQLVISTCMNSFEFTNTWENTFLFNRSMQWCKCIKFKNEANTWLQVTTLNPDHVTCSHNCQPNDNMDVIAWIYHPKAMGNHGSFEFSSKSWGNCTAPVMVV